MTVLVACETLLLALLVLLVAGLLRSHAELLRRIGPAGLAPQRGAAPAGAQRPAGVPLPDITGTTPAGDAMQVSLSGQAPLTLLVFLSSGCAGCGPFWTELGGSGLDELPPGVRAVVVAPDGEHDSPARIAQLAPQGLPVLMSERAWEDYAVTMTPYMVFVDPHAGQVIGEGTAASWGQLLGMLRDALADARPARRNGAARGAAVDATLADAGIGPGHPSLYPSGRSGGAQR
jgi:hypothetical protein